MLNVTKEQKGDLLSVKLIGSIEESVNFEQLLGTLPSNVEVNCKEIPRINSVGVKTWIKYFQTCQQKGVKIYFCECSTAIVEQMNLISNFTCGGSVVSIYVPFLCTNCKLELLGLFKIEDLKNMKFKLPHLNCTKCGSAAVFDDIPEEFFGFIMS